MKDMTFCIGASVKKISGVQLSALFVMLFSLMEAEVSWP